MRCFVINFSKHFFEKQNRDQIPVLRICFPSFPKVTACWQSLYIHLYFHILTKPASPCHDRILISIILHFALNYTDDTHGSGSVSSTVVKHCVILRAIIYAILHKSILLLLQCFLLKTVQRLWSPSILLIQACLSGDYTWDGMSVS